MPLKTSPNAQNITKMPIVTKQHIDAAKTHLQKMRDEYGVGSDEHRQAFADVKQLRYKQNLPAARRHADVPTPRRRTTGAPDEIPDFDPVADLNRFMKRMIKMTFVKWPRAFGLGAKEMGMELYDLFRVVDSGKYPPEQYWMPGAQEFGAQKMIRELIPFAELDIKAWKDERWAKHQYDLIRNEMRLKKILRRPVTADDKRRLNQSKIRMQKFVNIRKNTMGIEGMINQDLLSRYGSTGKLLHTLENRPDKILLDIAELSMLEFSDLAQILRRVTPNNVPDILDEGRGHIASLQGRGSWNRDSVVAHFFEQDPSLLERNSITLGDVRELLRGSDDEFLRAMENDNSFMGQVVETFNRRLQEQPGYNYDWVELDPMDVPFNDIPLSRRNNVAYRAAAEAIYRARGGDPTTIQQLLRQQGVRTEDVDRFIRYMDETGISSLSVQARAGDTIEDIERRLREAEPPSAESSVVDITVGDQQFAIEDEYVWRGHATAGYGIGTYTWEYLEDIDPRFTRESVEHLLRNNPQEARRMFDRIDRRLLIQREPDYAHPGELEAIDAEINTILDEADVDQFFGMIQAPGTPEVAAARQEIRNWSMQPGFEIDLPEFPDAMRMVVTLDALGIPQTGDRWAVARQRHPALTPEYIAWLGDEDFATFVRTIEESATELAENLEDWGIRHHFDGSDDSFGTPNMLEPPPQFSTSTPQLTSMQVLREQMIQERLLPEGFRTDAGVVPWAQLTDMDERFNRTTANTFFQRAEPEEINELMDVIYENNTIRAEELLDRYFDEYGNPFGGGAPEQAMTTPDSQTVTTADDPTPVDVRTGAARGSGTEMGTVDGDLTDQDLDELNEFFREVQGLLDEDDDDLPSPRRRRD